MSCISSMEFLESLLTAVLLTLLLLALSRVTFQLSNGRGSYYGCHVIKVLRRRYRAIGVRSSQQQLSGDVLHFINGILGVPLHGCSVNAASAGAMEADVPVVKR